MPRHGDDEMGWLRAQLARVTAERDQLQQHLDARAELDRALMMAAAAPAADGTGPIARVQGPRAAARRIPREARWLKVVPGFVLAAGIGLKAALKAAWVHPAATAAAAATGTGVAVLAAVVAVVPGANAHEHPPAAASIPGWHTTATPIPSTGPSIAAFVSTPKLPKLDAKSGAASPSSLPPFTYYAPPPSSPPSAAAAQSPPSAPAASAAVPATLQVSTTAIDLSSGLPATITLSATGTAGWVSWRISTRDPQTQARQADLDFSPSHGVLQAGEIVTVTISLDTTQDGAVQEVFSIAGQQVTATLPAPVPVSSPTGAVTDTPSGDPTDVPSPASS